VCGGALELPLESVRIVKKGDNTYGDKYYMILDDKLDQNSAAKTNNLFLGKRSAF
jgi:hypothetical protein